MSKEKIAIDLDDVLSSQIDVLIEFSNRKYGTNLVIDDFKAPGEYWGYYEQVWGVGKEEGHKRLREFLDEQHPFKQVILPETVEVIQKLRQKYHLEIVTARSLDYQTGTIKWLEQHLPGIFRNVHFVDLWHEKDEKATKAKICKEIGAGYLIDDNVEHCNLAAEAGIDALLFGEWGWSTGKKLHEDVIRVADWREVLEYFNERSR